MSKQRMPEMKEGSVNVTPLIDVVMCLIIFFMLVAKIGVSSGIDEKVDAPTTYLGVDIKDMSNILALNLYRKPGTQEPQVLIETGGKQKEIKFQENLGGKTVHPLQEILKDMKKERGDAFKVVINGGRDLEFAQIQLVLQECAVAGVSNVNFATRKATEVRPG